MARRYHTPALDDACGEFQVALMEPVDPGLDLVERRFVEQDIVRGLESPGPRRLRGEDGAGDVRVDAGAQADAGDLGRFRAVDHENPVEPAPGIAGLHEQGNHEDDVRAAGCREFLGPAIRRRP